LGNVPKLSTYNWEPSKRAHNLTKFLKLKRDNRRSGIAPYTYTQGGSDATDVLKQEQNTSVGRQRENLEGHLRFTGRSIDLNLEQAGPIQSDI